MDNRYEILKRVLDSLSEYDKSMYNSSNMTFEGFIEFVNHPTASVSSTRKLDGKQEPGLKGRGDTKETSIAVLLTYMFRYAKLYTKKALQGSVIQSPDEFSFLIILLSHKSISKTELINMNVYEKTTGMEIIKRMVRMGLMSQESDNVDKRSQRVSITDDGRIAIFSILDKMEQVSKIVAGNLSELEKQTLKTILEKLDHFHYDIFMNDRNCDLAKIIATKMTSDIAM